MKNFIEIYTDGSSLGNPGPGGWGVVVVKDEKIIENFGGSEKKTTNNRMELTGAIEALRFILNNHKNKDVVIHTDSAYVLGGVTSWVSNWEQNGWRTANKKPVLNKELWQELVALSRELGKHLSWQKVKGHSGHIYNDKADEIATNFSSQIK